MTSTTANTPAAPTQGASTPKAPQPPDPRNTCTALPPTTAPDLPKPKVCVPQCACPSTPGDTGQCFDKLIDQQAKAAAVADSAKAFKTELEGLLVKAKAAAADYTADKYQGLLKQWKTADDSLAALIKKLVCAIPCWYCVIECEICPLLYSIRALELKLNGLMMPYATVDSLTDLAYWWSRERDRRQDQFNRVKAVMTAWESPAKTIAKAIADNTKLISDAGSVLAPDIPKLLYDVFFRILPLHLAIAPPLSSGYTTSIDKVYVDLCGCDEDGPPDDCCGPNLGPLSMRSRLVGPQPYLIPPATFFDLMCCLVSNRYQPAKKALDDAAGELANATAAVTKAIADISAQQKSLPADAKTALSKIIDCSNYQPQPPAGGGGGCGCAPGGTSPGTATPPSTVSLN